MDDVDLEAIIRARSGACAGVSRTDRARATRPDRSRASLRFGTRPFGTASRRVASSRPEIHVSRVADAPRLDRPSPPPPVPRARVPAPPLVAEADEEAEADRGDTSEIGKLAVWSVTSAKPGNGVELLRDNNLDTYWQSDGAQPHLVNVQFQRKVRIRELALYADYKLDESYTPSKISVRAGNSFHDLREIKVVDLNEPVGWTRVRLDAGALGEDAEGDGGGAKSNDRGGSRGPGESLRAYFLQLAVLSNHQNGRDTHVRQVKIFGPRTSPMAIIGDGLSFGTPEFSQFATVR